MSKSPAGPSVKFLVQVRAVSRRLAGRVPVPSCGVRWVSCLPALQSLVGLVPATAGGPCACLPCNRWWALCLRPLDGLVPACHAMAGGPCACDRWRA
eukprot:359925-Chlamydomonas_euryale.AAC.6